MRCRSSPAASLGPVSGMRRFARFQETAHVLCKASNGHSMIYTFIMRDVNGATDLRQGKRPDHRAYLGAVADRIAFAGPLVDEDGKTIRGSLIALDFPERDAAQA